MPEELYVVNTNIEPSFLDFIFRTENSEEAFNYHVDFIKRVIPQCNGFGLPYLALLADGSFQIPYDYVGTVAGSVVDSIVDKGGEDHRDCTLAEYIHRLRVGSDTISHGQTMPITAVVEFSLEELYPEQMKRLGEMYAIKRINVSAQ